MMLTAEDIRAAVAAGIITEAQAASLVSLGHRRGAAREGRERAEEPFEVFRGFNEIFIVVGLTILFSGWSLLISLFGSDFSSPYGIHLIALSGLTMGGLALASGYFTLTRRMIAPSIALAIMFALSAIVLGHGVSDALGLAGNLTAVGVSAVVGLAMLWHYRRFRVPFSASLIALAAFYGVGGLFSLTELGAETAIAWFRLSGTGATAWLTLILGLVVFAFALRFDMSDPDRVGIRAQTGFWLHVIAAPAIVNTVSLRLLAQGGTAAQVALLVFLFLIAIVAIVIDRRSFLVSGAAYTVVLGVTLFAAASPLAILAMGFGLVALGANWERLRAWLMNALPEFPGKTRFPPYARTA